MILTAIPVGFVAGLFGIGGGLITVPFLYYIFESLGIDKQYTMHLAVGTSFAIIIPTSIVSVLTHHKFKAVDFDIVKTYGIFVILGVIFGTIFAASLKTKSLVLFFSIIIFLLGIYLLLLKERKKDYGTGIDISKKSINVSKINAKLLNLSNRSKFFHSSIDNFNSGKYDLIVSNPPYIELLNLKYLEKDVVNFEPKLALNGGLDGFSEIRKVFC